VTCQEPEYAGAQIGTSRLADLVPEQVLPVLLMASFSFCDREQNVAFLARASLRQVPIHRGFGAFIGQVLAPAAQLSVSTHPGNGSSNVDL
jgi:hypothetical protein